MYTTNKYIKINNKININCSIHILIQIATFLIRNINIYSERTETKRLPLFASLSCLLY